MSANRKDFKYSSSCFVGKTISKLYFSKWMHFLYRTQFPIVDYHFTTKDSMQKEIDNGEFIEYAVFSNNMYGTR